MVGFVDVIHLTQQLADAKREAAWLRTALTKLAATEPCGYGRERKIMGDPFHVHGFSECQCGERPVHNSHLHDAEPLVVARVGASTVLVDELIAQAVQRIRYWLVDNHRYNGSTLELDHVLTQELTRVHRG
jgi:hypothetical protein